MSILSRIQALIPEELERLHAHIHSALASGNPFMDQITEQYLTSKGKLIRPILVMLTARLFGPVDHTVLCAASAVEMLHNASLIHDDVIDQSAVRRGHPTVNSVWDNHVAVLTGDFFVSAALQQAIETGDLRVAATLSRLGKLLSLGEITQIDNARKHLLSQDAYFDIISRKTASLFVACVEMGAYARGLADGDERLTRLREFARLLGLCFQIRDDIFDYYDSPEVGKPTANDLREGKVTLPLLHALTRDDHPDRDAMLALVSRDRLTDDEITTLYTYAREAGGIDHAYDTMQGLHDLAIKELDALPEDMDTAPFRELMAFTVMRRS